MTRRGDARRRAGKVVATCLGCIGAITVAFVALVVLVAVVASFAPREQPGPLKIPVMPPDPEGAPAPAPAAVPAAVREDEAPAAVSPALMPEVAAFLRSHPEFGVPLSTMEIPDWSRGKRQRVRFDTGRSLLFYEKGGEVMTVWEDVPGRGRVVVWGETER